MCRRRRGLGRLAISAIRCVAYAAAAVYPWARLVPAGIPALAAVLTSAGIGAGSQERPQSAASPTYSRDVRPILQSRCTVCHNAGSVSQMDVSGGLALDSYAAVRAGVHGQPPIVVPGHSAQSVLTRRITATSPTQMMPRGGPPLPAEQIALIRRWIDSGTPAGGPTRGENTAPAVQPMPEDPARDDVTVITALRLDTPNTGRKPAIQPATLEYTARIGPLAPVAAIAFSPDGKVLAVGGYRAVTVWDTRTGLPVGAVTALSGNVTSLAFRPDGSELAVAGGAPARSGEVRVFDTRTLKQSGPVLGKHHDVVTAVAWRPDGAELATSSHDKTARIWSWPSGKELLTLRDNADAVSQVCWAPDGKYLYTAGVDHNLRRFDATTGHLERVYTGHGDAVTALAVSPDGHSLVSAGAEPALRWWNTDSGGTTRYDYGHSGDVNQIVFSRNGTLLASAGGDGTVRIWRATGEQAGVLAGASDSLYCVALTPDARLTAAAGADGLVRIWDTKTGKLGITLLEWPPARSSLVPDWLAITPAGYYTGSARWTAMLRASATPGAAAAPNVSVLSILRRPDEVARAWQGMPQDPVKLPAEAAAAPKPANRKASSESPD